MDFPNRTKIAGPLVLLMTLISLPAVAQTDF